MFRSGIFKPVRLLFQPVLLKPNAVQRRIIMQVVSSPYSGLPTYETLRKRFMASARDPESFYSRQRQEEARDKGQFVDVHDITEIQPSEFDVLISDITHETLESTISQDMGINYLAKAEPDADCVVESATGYIRRSGHRALVPLVVNHGGEARWVFFIIDSGSPLTYLSVQACKVLGIQESASVTVGGRPQICQESPSSSRFTDINLLGGDFCTLHKVHLCYDYVIRRVELRFGGNWQVVPVKG